MPDNGNDIIDSDGLKALAKIIQEQGGVLFLGPGVATYDNTGEPLIKKYVSKAIEVTGISYDIDGGEEKDNLSYITQYAIREDPTHLSTIKSNYATYFKEHLQDTSVYQNLARLNFKLVINTNPDNELYNEVKGLRQEEVYFDYLDGSNGRSSSLPETQDGFKSALTELSFDNNIWVQYNLLGFLDNPLSIRLCESDFIQLIRNIDAPGMIPPNIRNYVMSGVPLVFLGFNFEHWHYKIVCSFFGIGSTNINNREGLVRKQIGPKPVCIHCNEYPLVKKSKRAFFESEFRIGFQLHPISKYVRSLLHHSLLYTSTAAAPVKLLSTTVLYRETSAYDDTLADRFLTQLRILAGKKIHEPWSIKLLGGDRDYSQVKGQLINTDLLIVLLSADFYEVPDKCIDYNEEVKSILADKRRKNMLVIPVILRPHLYKDIPWLKDSLVRNNIQPMNGDKIGCIDSSSGSEIEAAIGRTIEFIDKKIDTIRPL